MISKKEGIMLAALAVGSIGLAAAVHGGGDADGGGGLGQPMGAMPVRTGGILGSQEGYGYTPKIDQAPTQAAVIFPEPPDYREVFDKFFKSPEVPVSRGAAGVSSAPKKKVTYTDTGRVAVGYEGYKMPFTPTPYAPGGYWSEAGMALGYEGYVTPLSPTPIAPKKEIIAPGGRSSGGAGSSSRGDSGTASPGVPYISKKPV